MSTLWPFPLIDEWTPAQKLTVYDFCRLMSEILWQQYEDVLLKEMMRIDRENGFDHGDPVADRNLELPFEDDLTF
ncbi:MAG: hypothetical protein H6978_16755 [Gammaproteobacteria bacterium]|nr:hypothetical protein [Gammaproteobacteria bacterium]